MIALSVVFIFSLKKTNAQVSINTSGNTPHASSILDMSDVNNKGLLVPNVALTSTSDNTTISSAAVGLLIYNTATVVDVTPGYYYWKSTVWTRFTTTTYNFENGLNLSGSAAKLGGDLTENTTIGFGSGFLNNDLIFDLPNEASNFNVKNSSTGIVIANFSSLGGVGKAYFPGNVSSGEYYNFDSNFGMGGYGFREKSGDLEYKKSGGIWSPFPDAPPVGGEPYWWYKPASTNYIRPQGNENVRVYDAGQTYGFYYNGNTNQYGGYFETSSATTPTSAVVGFSNVLGNETKGYLGYNGTYDSGNGLVVDGSAVYGVVDDKNRAAVFGRTTHDANVASIIGYSDVWISGYFFANDINAASDNHPALYGQLIVDVSKSGTNSSNQAAVQGYSEYTFGSENRSYTIGGDFTAIGGTQDASGIEAYSETTGAGTESYGVFAQSLDAETAYGVYAQAGTEGSTTNCYGIYGKALTSDGNGVVGMGSNLSQTNLYSSGNGDGVIGGSDEGVGVFGYFYDGSNANSYGMLGHSDTTGNFFYHYEKNGNGNGQSVMHASRYREATTASPGSSYKYGSTNQAIQGYNNKADKYTFAISGHCKSEGYGGTGGVFGSDNYAWGCLGYESFATVDYGVYASGTNTYGSGAGKENTKTGVGIGGYGDFAGAWFRGNVYGTITKGERFAQYIDGKTYTNDIIVKLEDNGKNERIATYVPTSMTADIYMRGTGQLQNGKATIKFDEDYLNIISDKIPVIVTVTAIGETSGIHLTELKTSGFAVAENNNSKGNIQFTWIAIAVRKGYENPENPKEVLSNDFDQKLDNFMFNENNTEQNGQPIWWDGTSIRYDDIPKTTEIKQENEPKLKNNYKLHSKKSKSKKEKSEVKKENK